MVRQLISSLWARVLHVVSLIADFIEWQVIPRFHPIVEAGYIPDFILRPAIRFMLKTRLGEERAMSVEQQRQQFQQFVEGLKQKPIAVSTGEHGTPRLLPRTCGTPSPHRCRESK